MEEERGRWWTVGDGKSKFWRDDASWFGLVSSLVLTVFDIYFESRTVVEGLDWV